MIKKTEKWVYYTCAKCDKKKFIKPDKYNGESELTCSSCKKTKQEPKEEIVKQEEEPKEDNSSEIY